jgi:hypothetical protein
MTRSAHAADVRTFGMPVVDYEEELDPTVQAKVRARFRGEMEGLAGLGFRELCFYRERFGLFSGLLNLPTFFLMWVNREVVSLHAGTQASASFILMYHDHPATVAVPLRLGVKLYTGFADRTLVISTSFPSCVVPRDGSAVIKHSARRPLHEAWAEHQRRVGETQTERREVARANGFEHYREFSRQEDAAARSLA